MRALWQDLAHASRAVLRSRGFTVTAALTLALGIGAVTALTSVLDALLFRQPAGVVAPERVVRTYFHFTSPQFGEYTNSVVSYPDFTDLQRARGLTAVTAQYFGGASLGRGSEAAEVSLSGVTGNFFPLMGTTPLLGRLLGPADDGPDAGVPAAVLSERLWRTRFGADSTIVGRTLALDDQVFTVVGVAPAGFDGGEYNPPDLWVPFTAVARQMGPGDEYRTDRGWYFVSIMARLAPGVTPAQAAAEATALIQAGRSDSTDSHGFRAVSLGPVLEAAGPDFADRASLARWLAAMSVVVLLIASANVANLLLARGLTRARELAIRKALGAGQGRLVRQLFLEGVMTSALAGALGMLIAVWGGGALRGYVLPAALAERFSTDGRVFAIALGATLVAALISSLVPALQVTRADLTPVLKEGGRGSGFRRSRLRAGLVVAQVALSVMLVIGAGLFVRSLRNMLAINIGYDAARVLMVNVDPAGAGFDGPATGRAFDAMVEAARAHPGVESAALTYGEPFGWSLATSLRVAGMDSLPRLSSGGPYIQRVTADYFQTMGLTILRGRGFTDQDRRAEPAVAMIGEVMARRIFGDRDPLGQCLMVARATGCAEIIGIVENGVRYSPREEEQALYYLPLQPPGADTRHLTLFLRTRGEATSVAAAIRPILQTAVPELPFVAVQTLQDVVEPHYQGFRVGATLFGLYGAVALLLAGLGLYSVLAYAVRGRTPELGIRLALGAEPRGLMRLVVGDGLKLTLLGAVLGVAGALAAGRALASLLYNVPAWDPLTLVLGTGTVLVAALLASSIPARRAARVDPVTALRSD